MDLKELRKSIVKTSAELESLIQKEEPFTKRFHDLRKQQNNLEKAAEVIQQIDSAKDTIKFLLK